MLNTEIFIQRARQVHGNKYDYSKVDYKGIKKDVIIICPIHGEFKQRADRHLEGKGCVKCGHIKGGLKRTMSQDDFIAKAKAIHGDKYDYSKVNFTNVDTKVCIICPKHGEFWQVPANHLRGCRCRNCNYGDTESFIKEASIIHNNKYDYSQVEYVDSKTPVTIICPIHGPFQQAPSNHLAGHGCSKCAVEVVAKTITKSQEQFILDAIKVHGNRYDYSNVQYINSTTKVCIICPEHGEFWQTPTHHLSGNGCPKCNSSKGELFIENYLKNYNINFINQYSIDIPISINSSGKAYIDFYLPDFNLFIEYNGEQHYKPISRFGGILKFEQQSKRDSFVRDYIQSLGKTLIEIPYNEDIKLKLDTVLQPNEGKF